MKKILVLLLTIIFSSFIYSENIQIKVPSFDKDGSIKEDTYTRSMPTTYEESIVVIRALVESYNTTSDAYKTELIQNKEAIEKISKELDIANQKINTLEDINNSKDLLDNTNKKLDTKFNLKNIFGGFGLIGEYGTINNSDEVSLQLGIRIWKVTLGIGPNVLIPRTNTETIRFGFRGSLGFWF